MARRRRAGGGSQAAGGYRYRSKTELALEAIGQALAWGLPPLPVLADAAYGNDVSFRQALRERQLKYAVQVEPTMDALIGMGSAGNRCPYADQRCWHVCH